MRLLPAVLDLKLSFSVISRTHEILLQASLQLYFTKTLSLLIAKSIHEAVTLFFMGDLHY